MNVAATVGALVLVGACVAGGCSQSRWSPTSDAISSARTRGTLHRPEPTIGDNGTRSLVMAEDTYGRLANTPLENASNTTMTAGVETGE